MADRQVLAVQGLAMLAVVYVRVVQVNEICVAIGDHHPMGRFGAGEAVAADQHQWLSAVLQYLR